MPRRPVKPDGLLGMARPPSGRPRTSRRRVLMSRIDPTTLPWSPTRRCSRGHRSRRARPRRPGRPAAGRSRGRPGRGRPGPAAPAWRGRPSRRCSRWPGPGSRAARPPRPRSGRPTTRTRSAPTISRRRSDRSTTAPLTSANSSHGSDQATPTAPMARGSRVTEAPSSGAANVTPSPRFDTAPAASRVASDRPGRRPVRSPPPGLPTGRSIPGAAQVASGGPGT
jgi:hypothetical protein